MHHHYCSALSGDYTVPQESSNGSASGGKLEEGSQRGPTFTFALVLDFQFRLLFTSGLEERTLVAVGFPVQPTHRALPGDVGTIWGTDATGFVLFVHSAFFPRAAVHVLAGLYEVERGMDQNQGQAVCRSARRGAKALYHPVAKSSNRRGPALA